MDAVFFYAALTFSMVNIIDETFVPTQPQKEQCMHQALVSQLVRVVSTLRSTNILRRLCFELTVEPAYTSCISMYANASCSSARCTIRYKTRQPSPDHGHAATHGSLTVGYNIIPTAQTPPPPAPHPLLYPLSAVTFLPVQNPNFEDCTSKTPC